MPKILFMCHGNVGRSQMAEAYYNHLTKSKDSISAGSLDYTVETYGSRLPSMITRVMEEEGVSMEGHEVKLATQEMVDECDVMYVMCRKERCLDFVKNSEKAIFWDIEDPYNIPFTKMRKIRDKIKEKVLEII